MKKKLIGLGVALVTVLAGVIPSHAAGTDIVKTLKDGYFVNGVHMVANKAVVDAVEQTLPTRTLTETDKINVVNDIAACYTLLANEKVQTVDASSHKAELLAYLNDALKTIGWSASAYKQSVGVYVTNNTTKAPIGQVWLVEIICAKGCVFRLPANEAVVCCPGCDLCKKQADPCPTPTNPCPAPTNPCPAPSNTTPTQKVVCPTQAAKPAVTTNKVSPATGSENMVVLYACMAILGVSSLVVAKKIKSAR